MIKNKYIKSTLKLGFLPVFIFIFSHIRAQDLYIMPSGIETRWTSPENPKAGKGAGAIENGGAKGHAFDTIPAHGSIDLLHTEGAGIIKRIELTVDDRSPGMLRSLR